MRSVRRPPIDGQHSRRSPESPNLMHFGPTWRARYQRMPVSVVRLAWIPPRVKPSPVRRRTSAAARDAMAGTLPRARGPVPARSSGCPGRKRPTRDGSRPHGRRFQERLPVLVRPPLESARLPSEYAAHVVGDVGRAAATGPVDAGQSGHASVVVGGVGQGGYGHGGHVPGVDAGLSRVRGEVREEFSGLDERVLAGTPAPGRPETDREVVRPGPRRFRVIRLRGGVRERGRVRRGGSVPPRRCGAP